MKFFADYFFAVIHSFGAYRQYRKSEVEFDEFLHFFIVNLEVEEVNDNE